MISVRKIEDPEHGHLAKTGILNSAKFSIQAAPAKLGFAFGVKAQVTLILLENLDDAQQLQERIRERRRLDMGKVIRRGMVLGITSIWGSHETPHR